VTGPLIHMDILVDKKQVDRAIWALDMALSGQSLVRFHEEFTRKILQERTSSRFDTEGDGAVGGKWAPLSESRQDIRASAGAFPSSPINTETGELRDWIVSNNGRATPNGLGATFSYPGATPRRVSVKAKYTTAQQGKPPGFPMPDGRGGTKPSPSPTPARPVVGLDAIDTMHVLAALELFIVAEVEKELL
jgi:hypothetical protein